MYVMPTHHWRGKVRKGNSMENIDLIFFIIIITVLVTILILQILSLLKKYKTDFYPLREEFKSNREELNNSIQKSREEMTKIVGDLNKRIADQLMTMQQGQVQEGRGNRKEIKETLDSFSKKLDTLTGTVDAKLQSIQKDNNEKLEKMRQTVDEKLSSTLEKRLGESFSLVSKNLEAVQKGLGEMQTLAADVGGLKKVLTNVKTKGIVGEYQLAALLEQVLAPNQYDVNVRTKTNSRDNVEFAIKIPSKLSDKEFIYLPIDSKFPTEDYTRLIESYDNANVEDIALNKKELEKKIKVFAKDIQTKYIDVPNTTEFGIMFLPVEGLYAEVLRIPGLFETIQRDYHVTITGPTTILAFLNSLQMGFRCLTVEKKTSEIWKVLGAVRTEFGKFGDILEKTRDKLTAATNELDKTGARSRAIEKQLRNVEALPEVDAQKLLGNSLDYGNEDDE